MITDLTAAWAGPFTAGAADILQPLGGAVMVSFGAAAPDGLGDPVIVGKLALTPGQVFFARATTEAVHARFYLGPAVQGSAPAQAPSITAPASATETDGGATVTYTFTPPSVSGNPAPTVTRVLTLAGVDVTSAMSGNTYVATKGGATQTLVMTYTAANGVSPNATSVVSRTVPAAAGAPSLFDFELLDETGSGTITSVPNLRIKIAGDTVFRAIAAVPGHSSLAVARGANGKSLLISGWTGGVVPAYEVHYEQALGTGVNEEANQAPIASPAVPGNPDLAALYFRRVGGPAMFSTVTPGMTVAATLAPIGAFA